MALFNSFTFGDVNSEDYGVYISGDSVYDSPARSVDLVQVPGRNGALALDNGYYENIEVTYPAGSFGTSQEEWREKMRGIRNALAAQRGYQKLIDTYHPEHYRLGMFLAGISASPVQYNRAGQFPIRFNCKPQRFLKSGDTPVEFTPSGQEESYGPSDIVSFEGVEGAAVTDLKVNIEPIQSGLGDPSPTNIRPISGHDSVNVTRTGKNLATPAEWVRKAYSSDAESTIRGRLFVGAFPVGTRLSISVDADFLATYRYAIHNMIKPYPLTGSSEMIDSGWKTTASYQMTTVNKYIGLCVSRRDNGEVDLDDLKAQKIMLNIGTPTDYVPFAGFDTYPISLNQTVYGGTLNVTTGVLTVDRAMVDLGTLTWTYLNDGIFRTPKINGMAFGYLPNWFCSMYSIGSTTNYTGWKLRNNQIGFLEGGNHVICMNTAYTDATAFKTAMNGVQLVYELATPTTVQLTPTEVTTLLGENNIWADSGEVEVKVVAPVDLTNPTNFASKPNIRVYGNGTVRVGDTIATVQNNTNYIDIDCEAMNCTDGTNNRNSDVSFSGNDFPVLEAGANSILLNGPSKVEITPRWWEL